MMSTRGQKALERRSVPPHRSVSAPMIFEERPRILDAASLGIEWKETQGEEM
jgi:hypothetical protein